MAEEAGGKKEKTVEEVTTLNAKLGDGEEYFGVAHIFASFNDTFVHITDLSGRETLCRVTGKLDIISIKLYSNEQH